MTTISRTKTGKLLSKSRKKQSAERRGDSLDLPDVLTLCEAAAFLRAPEPPRERWGPNGDS
jgi:hypothetical protein